MRKNTTERATTPSEIELRRLRNQRLLGTRFTSPAAAVAWFGAVQAQDYAGAKWAVGQRLGKSSDEALDRAFDRGLILRTHVLRPTWHFVVPEDLRWMLALTAPRIRAANAYPIKKFELDAATTKRSLRVIEGVLARQGSATREELARALQAAKIEASGLRLGYLMMNAEIECLIVSGPRRGKQFTYALADERAPESRRLPREEALAELTRRYFRAHGPALAKDFAWWSGLGDPEAQRGVAAIERELDAETHEGKRYFCLPQPRSGDLVSPRFHLLPNYDEYVIGYRDHGLGLDLAVVRRLGRPELVLGNHLVLRDGRIVGGWRRTFGKGAVTLEAQLPALGKEERASLEVAVGDFARFLGLPAELVVKR